MPFFSPPGSLIYSDDFESGSTGVSLSGGTINWSDNSTTGLTPGPQASVKYSTTQAFNGAKAVAFLYSANGATPPCIGYRAELRFDLGTGYTDVTWDCYMFTPTNFKHFASGSSNNNKMFRISPVSQPDPAVGLERLGASFERDSDDSSGLIGDWDTNDGGGMTQRGTYHAGFNLASESGTWHRWTVYCKAATASGGAGRAYLKIWKDGTLILDERPDIFQAESHNFRYGYWLGAMNGFCNGDTFWFMDRLRVYGL